jgi:hypothetical protein
LIRVRVPGALGNVCNAKTLWRAARDDDGPSFKSPSRTLNVGVGVWRTSSSESVPQHHQILGECRRRSIEWV